MSYCQVGRPLNLHVFMLAEMLMLKVEQAEMCYMARCVSHFLIVSIDVMTAAVPFSGRKFYVQADLLFHKASLEVSVPVLWCPLAVALFALFQFLQYNKPTRLAAYIVKGVTATCLKSCRSSPASTAFRAFTFPHFTCFLHIKRITHSKFEGLETLIR